MATKAKEKERKFVLECIEVYHSLPALWNVKSKDYSNRKKNNTNICFANIEGFPDADKNGPIKKFNSLRTNFRNELKWIKDYEKKWYWSRRCSRANVMVF